MIVTTEELREASATATAKLCAGMLQECGIEHIEAAIQLIDLSAIMFVEVETRLFSDGPHIAVTEEALTKIYVDILEPVLKEAGVPLEWETMTRSFVGALSSQMWHELEVSKCS